MRSMKLVALIALLAGSVAYAGSAIVYTLELGGDNHATDWEANADPMPGFTSGSTTGLAAPVANGDSVTWAVRVTVGGAHEDATNTEIDGQLVFGAANLVFDLELYDSQGQLVPVGAAPLSCDPVTLQCEPTAAGFWSSINDGDEGGDRGLSATDTLANAAFAIAVGQWDPNLGQSPPTQLLTLIDAAPYAPNFDYGWFPASNGRSGVDIDGLKSVVAISDPALDGKLVGFGAGYKNYNYTDYAPGVGKLYVDPNDYQLGFGGWIDEYAASQGDPTRGDPLAPAAALAERPLFEGQICTKGLPAGTYTLKVVPSAEGNNVLHGAVQWWQAIGAYGTMGSFAVKANDVYPKPENNPGISFEVTAPPTNATVAARHIFYNNSYYDTAGDANAIDPSKTALLPGDGAATFANWTGYNKGINGLIYDIAGATTTPTLADFQFVNQGKAGTGSTVVNTATLVTQADTPVAGTTRCIITFPDADLPLGDPSLSNTWLQVTVQHPEMAAADVSYWGNVVGDTGMGNTTSAIIVDPQDEVMCRPPYLHNAFNRALVDDTSDLNKNSLVDPQDEVLCRPPYTTNAFTAVKVITR